MASKDTRRDPVEVIRHARTYLKKTRGEKLFERSLAGRILAEAERRSAKCIDYLITPEMRKRFGMYCPCEFHEAEHQATLPARKAQPQRSGKEAAAGEHGD